MDGCSTPGNITRPARISPPLRECIESKPIASILGASAVGFSATRFTSDKGCERLRLPASLDSRIGISTARLDAVPVQHFPGRALFSLELRHPSRTTHGLPAWQRGS